MRDVFTGILNISISATFLIVVCVLVRKFFRNMPKFIRCFMWLLVALRLAVPFSIESSLSLLPTKEYVTIDQTGNHSVFNIASDNASNVDYMISGNLTDHESSFFAGLDLIEVVSFIWIIGMISLLIYALFSYIRLHRNLYDAVLLCDNIYQSERVKTAFVLGIIRPRIYIPFGLSTSELYMVINHERAHITRRDYLIKPLGFIISAVYWFNPAVWLAYILLCRDIELACDEKVIKKIGYDKKKAYSQTLLDLSIPRKYISACPVAFGEVGVNERVKNVLKLKKAKAAIIAAALIICVIIGVCFLTYPKATKSTKNEASTEQAEQIEKAEADSLKNDDKSKKDNKSENKEADSDKSATIEKAKTVDLDKISDEIEKTEKAVGTKSEDKKVVIYLDKNADDPASLYLENAEDDSDVEYQLITKDIMDSEDGQESKYVFVTKDKNGKTEKHEVHIKSNDEEAPVAIEIPVKEEDFRNIINEDESEIKENSEESFEFIPEESPEESLEVIPEESPEESLEVIPEESPIEETTVEESPE